MTDLAGIKNRIAPYGKSIAAGALILIAMLLFALTKDSGMGALIRWLCACFLLALLMKPVLVFRNLNFPDGGFALSLSLGLAVSFLFTWLISACLGIPYNNATCIICLLVLSAVFYGLYFLRGRQFRVFESTDRAERFLMGFALFVLIVVLGVYVRGFKPEITPTTEQYMDFGFMQTIFRQEKAIPDDLWFAGERLNYYYLGQSLSVFMCRLAFIQPEYGYFYMLITVFAASALSVYSDVCAFVQKAFMESAEGMSGFLKSGASHLAGLTASALSFLGGNGHYLVYGLIDPIYRKITGNALPMAEEKYWFASSTAFIGYYPEVMDKGKHEFPSYTFVLGDLHAHAVNIMFVVPLIILLLDYSLDPKEECASGKVIPLRKLMDLRLSLIGILLGLFHGTNYWDFPIYFVVSGAVILFCDLARGTEKKWVALNVLRKGILVLAISELVIFPFTLTFNKMIGGIKIAQNHSPLNQMLILWGAPAVLAVTLFIVCLMNRKTLTGRGTPLSAVYALVPCGLGLVLVPEIIYVKDIYGEGFERYNTMFKLTYQAFLILGICAGILMGIALLHKKMTACILLGIYTVLCSSYIFCSIWQFMGNPLKIENRMSCNSMEFLSESYDLMPEWSMIQYINGDRRKMLHIMESSGSSYTPDNKISVFTGAQAVVGWDVHEWLWHSYWDPVGIRGQEVYQFYTFGDPDYCRKLVEKYDINYIVLGPREYDRYEVNKAGFDGLYEKVLTSENGQYCLYFVK